MYMKCKYWWVTDLLCIFYAGNSHPNREIRWRERIPSFVTDWKITILRELSQHSVQNAVFDENVWFSLYERGMYVLEWEVAETTPVHVSTENLYKFFFSFGIHQMDLMSETWSINLSPILESIDTLISKKDELGCAVTTSQTPDFVCSRRYVAFWKYYSRELASSRERSLLE